MIHFGHFLLPKLQGALHLVQPPQYSKTLDCLHKQRFAQQICSVCRYFPPFQELCTLPAEEGEEPKVRETEDRGCDVLDAYLRQFENVLLAINDLQDTIGQPSTYVSRMKPAICIKDLSCLLLVVVIAFEDIVALETDLEGKDGS